jgi:cysteine desulfurase
MDPEVFEAMKPYFLHDFGNPSSTHSHGRKARAAIESARKKIAELLNCTPGEIIFTSGGTEANNTILTGAVRTYSPKTIITSALEHHAVLHTIEQLSHSNPVSVHFVNLDERGNVDLFHLEELLRKNPGSLVSLMQANNEIGNLLDIQRVGELCAQSASYFHSDTVQAVGHYRHDLKAIPVHGINAAAHKFHGPKGTGFMFLRKDRKIGPYILGGGQERNMRGGTESVPGIIGLARALEIAYQNFDEHIAYIKGLKTRMIGKLRENIPGVYFNGNSGDVENSLYTVLNVSLPESEENDMLLFNLDLVGISASGGSACSSGATIGSHVLQAIKSPPTRGAVRFSFSKLNTIEEVDYVAEKLKERFAVRI